MKERKILCDKFPKNIETEMENFGDWDIVNSFDSEGYITIILEKEIKEDEG